MKNIILILSWALLSSGRAVAPEDSLAAKDKPWPSPLGRFLLVSAEGLHEVELDGAVSWSYYPSGSAKQFHGSEDDLIYDGWVLPNQNYLLSTHRYVREINHDKRTIWEYRVVAPAEVKSGVPLPNGNVAALDSREQAILELETGTGRVLHRTPVPAKGDDHSRYMLLRRTPEGTYIVALRHEQRFVEVDLDGKLLRSYSVPQMPVMAQRLADGSTIGTGYFGMIRLDPQWQETWSYRAQDAADRFALQLPWGVTELTDKRLLVANSDWHLKDKDGNKVQGFTVDLAKQVTWMMPCAVYPRSKENPEEQKVEYHSVRMLPLPATRP